MAWKEIVRDYFTFSRRQRVAIISLLVIIICLIISPAFFPSRVQESLSGSDSTLLAQINQILDQDNLKVNPDSSLDVRSFQFEMTSETNTGQASAPLTFFDPNTISKEDWKKLGLREKTARTISNYLAKGGRFRKKEDLQKIYGMNKRDYERLAPYIKINSNTDNPGRIPDDRKPNNTDRFPEGNAIRTSLVIDINAADTAAFIALPGIGSKLAARIINFRDKLGGFYSVDQVSETYGLPDSTFNKIGKFLQLKTASLRKIDINKATRVELSAHPYINRTMADAIVAYRNQHGDFKKPEDIKAIMVISEEAYNKFAPYLTTE